MVRGTLVRSPGAAAFRAETSHVGHTNTGGPLTTTHSTPPRTPAKQELQTRTSGSEGAHRQGKQSIKVGIFNCKPT